MASGVYTTFYSDCLKGNIDCDTDTFYMMLVTSSYTFDKNHDRRSDITNEITGTGYTAGGAATTCSVSVDTGANTVSVDFTSVAWTGATFTTRAGVVYKRRGGASSADELVAYYDFGADKSPSAETFTVTFSDPITIQN